MPVITSNRELYRVVTATLQRRSRPGPALELYLARLRQTFIAQAGVPMTADGFAAALDAAFEGETPVLDTSVLQAVVASAATPAWHRQLARQLIDLREMAEAGTLERDDRYFGVDAPSGARWYNFDPHAFVECGLSGSFGGWEPGDDTGRELVPGTVAVVGADNTLTPVKPEELDEPHYSLTSISWEQVEEFLWAGQNYE